MLITVFILAVVFSVAVGTGAVAEYPKIAWTVLSFAVLAAGVSAVGVLT